MGLFSRRCYLTMADISDYDTCHGIFISDKQPYKILGYVRGTYDGYGNVVDIEESFVSDNFDIKEDKPTILLHSLALSGIENMDVSNLMLEYPLLADEAIPKHLYDAIVKVFKVQGFFVLEDGMADYNGQHASSFSKGECLLTQELLQIYKKHEDFLDETPIATCHMSAIPIYEGDVFHKLTFATLGWDYGDCLLIRDSTCKFKDGKIAIIDEVFNKDECAKIKDFGDYGKIPNYKSASYYSFYVCKDIYDFIKRSSIAHNALVCLATHPPICFAKFSYDKKRITEMSVLIGKRNADLSVTGTELVFDHSTLCSEYKIISLTSFINSSIYERVNKIINLSFYEHLARHWIVTPKACLSNRGGMHSLMKKPKEIFKIKKMVIEESLRNTEVCFDLEHWTEDECLSTILVEDLKEI